MDTVGQRIKKLREIRGYTQKQLAQKAAVHEMTIQFYEYETRKPKQEQLEKLAEALEIDIAFLHPSKMDTPYAPYAIIFDLIQQYGNIKAETINDCPFWGIDGDENPLVKLKLNSAKDACETLSLEDFQKWLIESSPYEPTGTSPDNASQAEENPYTTLERIVYLKSSLRDLKLILGDKAELIDNCINNKDYKVAKMHLDTLMKTVGMIIDESLDKY